jgi:hypothetical protein
VGGGLGVLSVAALSYCILLAGFRVFIMSAFLQPQPSGLGKEGKRTVAGSVWGATDWWATGCSAGSEHRTRDASALPKFFSPAG